MNSCEPLQGHTGQKTEGTFSLGHVARAMPGMSRIPGVPSINVKEMYI